MCSRALFVVAAGDDCPLGLNSFATTERVTTGGTASLGFSLLCARMKRFMRIALFGEEVPPATGCLLLRKERGTTTVVARLVVSEATSL